MTDRLEVFTALERLADVGRTAEIATTDLADTIRELTRAIAERTETR